MYAFHQGAPEHQRYRAWLQEVTVADEPFGLADSVLAGFVRVATHPKVFSPPDPVDRALAFADALRDQPNAVVLIPERGTGPSSSVCAAELAS